MEGKKAKQVLFIFWIILAILSSFWIIFTLLFDISLILTRFVYQFLFILSCCSITIAILSIREILSEVKSQIIEEKFKEKSIRDYYQYTQLLDPPEMNN